MTHKSKDTDSVTNLVRPTSKKNKILQSTSKLVIGTMERFFYRWGLIVATHPLKVILVTILLTGICSGGFYYFRTEADAEKLWLPSDSSYIANKKWKKENYKEGTRGHIAFTTHEDNVLTPEGMLKLLELHRAVNSVNVDGMTYSDFCFKIPITDLFGGGDKKKSRKRRQVTDFFDERDLELSPENIATATTRRTTQSAAATGPADSLSATAAAATAVLNEAFSVHQSFDASASAVSPATTERSSSLAGLNDIGDVLAKKSSAQKTSPLTPTTSPTTAATEYYNLDDEESPDEEDEDYPDYYGETFNFYSPGEDYDESTSPAQQKEEKDNELPPEVYCDLVTTLEDKCGEYSLLEIWNYDEDRIRALTQEDIVEAINTLTSSPVFGYDTDFTSYLGAKKYNSTGHVIGANSIRSVWLATFDPEKIKSSGKSAGIELDLADPFTMEWELQLIDVLLNLADDIEEEDHGYALYIHVARSFADITTAGILVDGVRMVCGYALMFAYTMFMLGKWNMVEHRSYLAMMGILAVGFGLIISLGITMFFGFPYTPIHGILPFLALGIGIDDMFVIIQCWNNLPDHEKNGRTLPEKIALTMQHAGVAITVTSVTDVFAFGVGSVTILPGLQAFCIACAIAIAAIFILQTSWFVAWMTIDERRIEAHRDGFTFLKHRNWIPNAFSQRDWGQVLMRKVANVIKYRIVQAMVILGTLGVFGVGVWGTLQIRVEFDPVLLLPAESYLRQWININNEHFPKNGWASVVYTGELNYNLEEFEKLDHMIARLEKATKEEWYIVSTSFWWSKMKRYMAKEKDVEDWREAFESGKFPLYFSDFLFHKDGAQEREKSFKFDGELECGEAAPRIKSSKLGKVNYAQFSGPEEHIPARAIVFGIIEEANFNSPTFSHAQIYSAWETDEVIVFELWRNLALAMVCVFVITLILLADLKICLMVLSCVLLTLVDITGMIHFWGLTIDTISCVNIVLGVGLCVDYSAHIAHAFIVSEGTSKERSANALEQMGPAILNGGITTFLALFFLAFSQSYAFIVFFKVFFLTVIFGLFHGLVFLPVVLIVLGSNNEAPSRSVSVSSGYSDSSSVDAQLAKGIKPAQNVHNNNTIAVGNKGFVPDERH